MFGVTRQLNWDDLYVLFCEDDIYVLFCEDVNLCELVVGVVHHDDQFLIWITLAEARHDSVYSTMRDSLKEVGIGVVDYFLVCHTPEP